MDNSASIYIFPALIALAVKLFLLLVSKNGRGRNPIFFTMVFLFACHNLAEVLGFLEFFKGVYSEQILRWYYVMTVFSVFSILHYAAEISGLIAKTKIFFVTTVVVAIPLSVFILLSDTIIRGASSIGYIITAVKGPQYWVFQTLCLATFMFIAGVLIVGYLSSKDDEAEIRCGYTFLALLPMVIVGISVQVSMTMGESITVNAAGIAPICTTFFLLFTIIGERTHTLTDVRRHIPFSLERRTSSEIMDIFSRYAQEEVNYRDCMAELEKLIVVHKHSKNQGNVTQTAASMEIPRSSLYSIFQRLGIEAKDIS